MRRGRIWRLHSHSVEVGLSSHRACSGAFRAAHEEARRVVVRGSSRSRAATEPRRAFSMQRASASQHVPLRFGASLRNALPRGPARHRTAAKVTGEWGG
eukprot:scaffold928_cov370-Prasinococcus_capsulatus_cf.AAC.22